MTGVEDAVADIAAGRFVIVTDDENRENEGDLTIAAEKVTAEAINFMARHGRGLICTPIEGSRLDELHIPAMVSDNTSNFGTAFSVSIEARGRVTTGISAADRANTIQALLDPKAIPEDFQRPGHTFPLRAREGGVLVRAGQTEAAVDLARMAGLYPAGVICEIMKQDGTMARLPDLRRFARRWGLRIVTIRDLIAYRRAHEKLVRREAVTDLPTPFGTFRAYGYVNTINGEGHVALVMGDLAQGGPPLVRVHSECLTGDVFHSLRCDCGQQLEDALRIVAEDGRGVVLYLRQEGRGIGLIPKLRAYALQDEGLDTVEANERLGFRPDEREYGIGSQILVDLGCTEIRVLSNNPHKYSSLEGYGLHVVEQVPLRVAANPSNRRYLETKRQKLGHDL
jgi:3,4-dihydroxy 2-butanone 4-phosphate synthase/GTP cyclohydrolase II